MHLVGLGVAVETDGPAADGDLGAELLGLGEGAPRERLAGNPRRESEVVLDPRTGTGLPAGRRALEHQDVQALGCPVYRRGQTRGAGPDDHQVPRRVRVQIGAQPQIVGQQFDGRVPQHVAALAHHDRHFAHADVKAIQELLHGGLRVDVLIRVGLRVPGQKLPQLKRVRGVARPDEHHLASALGNQPHAPKDESAHQDLAQSRVALNQRTQMFAVDHDDLTVPRDPTAHESAAPGQHVDLARELAGPLENDPLFAVSHGPQDLQLPLDHHEELRVAIADLEHHVASPHLSALADAGYPVNLGRVEPGEHLGAAVELGIGHVVVLGPLAFDRQPRVLPVEQAAGIVTDVAVAVLAQLLNRRQAGVAVLVRAVDDDLLVLAQLREHLGGRPEMD